MGDTDLAVQEEVLPTTVRGDIESARAVQEVQASFIIAKRFPRDEIGAELRIVKSCERYSLAEQAVYAYPRGREKVTGPSIRLAEAIAQKWGNIKYGFRILETRDVQSEVEAYCYDLETNTHISRSFTVEHKMLINDGHGGKRMKILIDPRDIYELIANYSQRRVRACILEIIPGDVVEKAVKTCEKTLIKGQAAVPHAEAVKIMFAAFDKFGVSKDLIEKRLGHGSDAIVPEELADLKQIINSLKDQQSRREDWFEFGKREEGGKAGDLKERIKAKAPSPAPDSFDNFQGEMK